MLSITVGPPEIEDCYFQGHLGGNFSKGYANGSAVGTLIGRTIGLLMLDKLPEVKLASAANVSRVT